MPPRSQVALLRVRVLCGLLLAFWSASLPAPQFQYCNSWIDYYVHMQAHRERAKRLTLAAYDLDPAKFPNVDRRLLWEFMAGHDESKLNLELTPAGERAVVQQLYDGYGQDFGTLPKEKAEAARALVRKLNGIDDAWAQAFFKKHGITDYEVQQQYLQLEKIGDFHDRYFDPVAREEFGREMAPGSRSALLNARSQEIAKRLESLGRGWYEATTADYSFLVYRTGRVSPAAANALPPPYFPRRPPACRDDYREAAF